jgi:hypothetical protein
MSARFKWIDTQEKRQQLRKLMHGCQCWEGVLTGRKATEEVHREMKFMFSNSIRKLKVAYWENKEENRDKYPVGFRYWMVHQDTILYEEQYKVAANEL